MRHSILCLVALGLVACNDKPKTSSVETQSAPVEPPKDTMKSADADMKKVLVELAALDGKPIASVTALEARKQPTPGDAVKRVLAKDGKSTEPLEVAKVENRKFPGAGGPLDARIYTPKLDEKAQKKSIPIVAYWHGGGFVIADLDTYDASARAIAQNAEAIVVALDYRHAPEAKFPAAHDDAFAGYEWVVKNAASFGGDPSKIAVAGESAGGNLAANVAIMARDRQISMPVHELLIYPVAQSSMSTPSYNEWDNAKPLNKAMMEWFVQQYTSSPADMQDPRISLVNANLAGLPTTTIINAEIDPLRSDGDMLSDKLRAAKVQVSQKTYDGVTHEFFGMGAVVSDAKLAEAWAGKRLKDSFSGAERAWHKNIGP